MNGARVEFAVTVVVAKEGELCWLGHLDFARAVERALRRSGLPLCFSEGFHRRVKLRLPEPLPLGVGSEGERFVVPLAQPRSCEEVAAALHGGFPRGLRLVAAAPGSQPEPRDVPIELELVAAELELLARALRALPAEAPAIGGRVEILEDARADARGARALVRLVPPPTTRVSIGRFLELLKQGAPEGFALSRIHRRVAWRPQPPSLPSSAPLPEPGAESSAADAPPA